MNEQIFRKSALDRLSSPEQLDMAITVMKPRAWLILTGLLVILIAIGIWGLAGTIENSTRVLGMITSSGGSQDVLHGYNGSITDIGVKVGSMVKRGDVVAHVSQNETVNKINNLQYDLNVLNSINLKTFDPSTMIFSPNSDTVSDMYEQACYYKNGFISTINTQSIVDKFEAARKLEISKLQSAINENQNLLKVSSEIIAPADGVISNIYINKDTIIAAGQPIMSIMQYNELTSQLQAVLYEDYRSASRIQVGQKVKIVTQGLAKEQGFLMGTVISVSDTPTTPEHMRKTLGSADAVTTIINESANGQDQKNSYLEIRVALDVDPNNSTGYKWSVANPPVSRVVAGGICEAYIVVGSYRPLGLLIASNDTKSK